MSSRLLMSATALALAASGIACSFAPQELLAIAGLPAAPASVLGVQALGAAYLGLAMLDWMARGAPFGGIYGRPVAMGNGLHFTVLAFALGKVALAAPSTALVVFAVFAAVGALSFWRLLFFPPADIA